jgi:methylamine dehydrogenase accessory protein MauD
MTPLFVSQALLWIVVAALALTVFALARQIGVLHERIAPAGALAMDQGPGIGDAAPQFTLTSFAGSTVAIGGQLPMGQMLMLLFVAPSCPMCKKLLPIATSFARNERLGLVFVGDGDLGEQRAMVKRHELNPARFVSAPEVGFAFRVGKLPYAVVLDDRGTILAKGLVNSREHLESLIVAQEVGFASIQDYVRAGARGGHGSG